jgi:hypothetical protein
MRGHCSIALLRRLKVARIDGHHLDRGRMMGMSGQEVTGALVQATNLLAAVSFTVNFKEGAEKELGREFLDCKSNGISGPREASVPKRLPPVLAIPHGEQFCWDAVIEWDHWPRPPSNNRDEMIL